MQASEARWYFKLTECIHHHYHHNVIDEIEIDDHPQQQCKSALLLPAKSNL